MIAKPGTSIHPLPDSPRAFVLSERLAGFLETDGGTKIFSVYAGGPSFADVVGGFVSVNDDVNAVAAAFQQDPE